jgi:hypothetical protein
MKHVNLRLDDELHADLTAAARKNHRSLQQQIIWQLEAPYLRHRREHEAGFQDQRHMPGSSHAEEKP